MVTDCNHKEVLRSIVLTFVGKGTASPLGRQALTISDASGLSLDIMKPSNDAELFFPSLPESN